MILAKSIETVKYFKLYFTFYEFWLGSVGGKVFLLCAFECWQILWWANLMPIDSGRENIKHQHFIKIRFVLLIFLTRSQHDSMWHCCGSSSCSWSRNVGVLISKRTRFWHTFNRIQMLQCACHCPANWQKQVANH